MNKSSYPVFDVIWTMLPKLNPAEQDCRILSNSFNYVLVCQRVMEMAKRIVSSPKRVYNIKFDIVDSMLHPFLGEVVSYFHDTKKNIAITYQVNNVILLNELLQLGLAKHAHGLELLVNAQKVDIKEMLFAIARAIESGLSVIIKPDFDNKNRQIIDQKIRTIIKLRTILPFQMDFSDEFSKESMAIGDSERENWRQLFLEAASSGATQEQKMRFLPECSPVMGVSAKRANRVSKKSSARYCCQGIGKVFIDADGSFSGSRCINSVRHERLWEQDKRVLEHCESIIRCEKACPSCLEDKAIPCFDSAEAAEKYAAMARDYLRDRHMRWRHLGSDEKQRVENIFKARLALEHGGNCTSNINKNHHILKKKDELAYIYHALIDDESRGALLEALGNIAGVPESTQTARIAGKNAGEHGGRLAAWLEHARSHPARTEKLLPGAATMSWPLRLRCRSRWLLEGKFIPGRPESINQLHFLIECLRNYDFYLRAGEESGALDFYALPSAPYLPDMPGTCSIMYAGNGDSTGKAPAISIIIAGRNIENEIVRQLDSVVVQNADNYEIIVVDAGSTDRTVELVKGYQAYWGRRLALFELGEEEYPGAARNFGLNRANGKFVTFLEKGGLPDREFIARYLAKAEETGADIVGTRPFNRSRTFDGIYPGGRRWTGQECLGAFLMGELGGPEFSGRVYNRDFLLRNGISFDSYAGQMDAAFSLLAFFFARNICALHDILYTPTGNTDRIDFEEGINFLAETAIWLQETVSMPYGSKFENEAKYFFKNLFHTLKPALINSIKDSASRGYPSISKDILLKAGNCRIFLECVIEDYACMVCKAKCQTPQISSEDRDMAISHLPAQSIPAYVSVRMAPIRAGHAPRLSIITANYNKESYLDTYFKSIFAQDFTNFEIIIVDDCSHDRSVAIIEKWVAIHPEITLIKMSANAGQSVCQNIGLSEASGDYITFIDSDDQIYQGFFRNAVRLMDKSAADLSIFSIRSTRPDGSCIWQKQYNNESFTGSEGLKRYLSQELLPSTWAKVYKRSFLSTQHCRFQASLFYEDVLFFTDVLEKTQKVITSNVFAYNNVNSPDSIIRSESRKYLHIHSMAIIAECLNRLTNYSTLDGNKAAEILVWNLENSTLQAWAAFFIGKGRFELTVHDFNILRTNRLFLYALFAGWANFSQKYNPAEGTERNARDVRAACLTPLVSVIVPVFNQEKLIGRCVESIFAQTLQNFEVILIDDASTDCTRLACEELARQDGRVRFFHNETNRGQGYSRNLGMKEARGEFIIFMDSDDYALRDFFLHASALLVRHPQAEMAHLRAVSGQGELAVAGCLHELREVAAREMLDMYCNGKGNLDGIWSYIYRRSFLLDNRISFPEHFFEDAIFILKTFIHAHKILQSDFPAYVHTVTPHEASTMAPTRYTPRHLKGNFAVSAGISKLLSDTMPAESGDFLARKRIRARYNGFARTDMANYVHSFADTGISPLTEEDLKNLADCPELFESMFRDYAECHATRSRISLCEALPANAASLILREHHGGHEKRGAHTGEQCLSIIFDPVENFPGHYHDLLKVLQEARDRIEIIFTFPQMREGQLAEYFQLAREFPGIRIFSIAGESSGNTLRSELIKAARGRYVLFMNNTQRISPDFPGWAMRNLEKFGADMLVSGTVDLPHIAGNGKLFRTSDIDAHSMEKFFEISGETAGGLLFLRSYLLKNHPLRPFLDDGRILLLDNILLGKSSCGFLPLRIVERNHPVQDMTGLYISEDRFNEWVEWLKDILQTINHEEICKKNIFIKEIKKGLLDIECRFKEEIFGVVQNCKKSSELSKIAEKMLSALTISPEFFRMFMAAYAKIVCEK